MTQPIRQRTSYATIQEAQADGWRRFFGYVYKSPDGRTSTTITLTQERNMLGQLGCCVEMYRDSAELGE